MNKKKPAKKKALKPGLYRAMITKVEDTGNGYIDIQLKLEGVGFTYTENLRTKPTKLAEPDPHAGHHKFFVLCRKLGVYTSIGADNVHHASNKANKLFGPNWSSLCADSYLVRGYEHASTIQFRELLSELKN